MSEVLYYAIPFFILLLIAEAASFRHLREEDDYVGYEDLRGEPDPRQAALDWMRDDRSRPVDVLRDRLISATSCCRLSGRRTAADVISCR